MTTRPYWPHSNPEPPAPITAAGPVHVAVPPSTCLNGCHTGTGPERQPVEVEAPAKLCGKCVSRIEGWLRVIPDSYGLLPLVVEHGTIPGNPGSAHMKVPDAPAPMRLEIVDLLDTRRGVQFDDDGQPLLGDNRRGVFGTVVAWGARVRLERDLPRSCDCGHPGVLHRWAPPLVSLCRADCRCTSWAVTASVAGECAFLGQHLPWITEQAWAGDLHDELKPLARQLSDAVGEFRPKAVGMCMALVPAPGAPVDVLCGGALMMDRSGYGVECGRCGNRHEADDHLRELGVLVGLITDTDHNRREAS